MRPHDVLFDESRRRTALNEQAAAVVSLPGAAERGRPVLRGLGIAAGSACMAGALGLWLLSGSGMDAQLVSLKVAISLGLLYAGIHLLEIGRGPDTPEIQLDLGTRELRLVEARRAGRPPLVRRYGFNRLGDIRLDGADLVVEDAHGRDLIRVAVGDTASRARIEALLA